MGKKERQSNDDFHKRCCSTVFFLLAGFGNKPTDVEAYREIGLSPRRIFIVNKVKIAVLYIAE
jgi:phosphatidate phosphatase PAH1